MDADVGLPSLPLPFRVAIKPLSLVTPTREYAEVENCADAACRTGSNPSPNATTADDLRNE
jgi:hypothetical protein